MEHHQRPPAMQNAPDESAFTIGNDDDDSDDEHFAATQQLTPSGDHSRASSIASEASDALPTQVRRMSEKARGKMPVRSPAFSRQNSMTSIGGSNTNGNGNFEPTPQWIESWLPELPLHPILTVIDQLTPSIPRGEGVDSRTILQTLQNAHLHGIDPSPMRIQSFEWSPLSLGWYESLLWSFVYVGEMQASKGTAGVWNGTAIRLFRVQETAPEGPSLTRPRGAVDAVGSNIVSRIGNINLGRVSQLANGAVSGRPRADGAAAQPRGSDAV